ncbi:PREDICTED: probable salivary secreted peptide [Ceratosolen solmsi marchali]|uniref:Probable salivary secreted peptide n=1 Tax=Ceratosolen solmsi marchali TaxID=326594 RepID=A0AAJ6YHP1_9HYME|nr:PREDICTED: probable salivary secreted peptide [Ceratosolen solmsi marchali]
MSNSKYICAVYFIVILTAVFIDVSSNYVQNYAYYKANNKSHNLIIGNRQLYDCLVHQENVIKSSKWLQVIEVYKTFNISRHSRITQIRALDKKTNGNGAMVSNVTYGVGYSNLTLKFKSQRSHGINFVVELYAKPCY